MPAAWVGPGPPRGAPGGWGAEGTRRDGGNDDVRGDFRWLLQQIGEGHMRDEVQRCIAFVDILLAVGLGGGGALGEIVAFLSRG